MEVTSSSSATRSSRDTRFLTWLSSAAEGERATSFVIVFQSRSSALNIASSSPFCSLRASVSAQLDGPTRPRRARRNFLRVHAVLLRACLSAPIANAPASAQTHACSALRAEANVSAWSALCDNTEGIVLTVSRRSGMSPESSYDVRAIDPFDIHKTLEVFRHGSSRELQLYRLL